MDKRINKKSPEELQGLMHFRKRGYWLKNRKGKGSYNRADFKKFEQTTDDTTEGVEAN